MKNKSLLFLVLLSLNTLTFAQISFAPLDTVNFYGNGTSLKSANRIQHLDFDGDGNQDLVFRREYEVVLRPGNGDGTWQKDSVLYSQKNAPIYTISNLYDINYDGFFDLAILSQYQLTILLGSADGFVLESSGFFQNYFDQLEWQDYNNDGIVDLVAETYEAIVINFNWVENGVNFEPILITPPAPLKFKFLDINIDGYKDLVLATTEKLIVYLGNSAGEFSEIYSRPSSYLYFQTGDVSMDGYIDIVFEENNQITSLIFDNNTDSFSESLMPNHNNYFYQRNPTLIDIDNNLSLDIVFGTENGGVAYMSNTGGAFNTTVQIVSESYSQFNSLMFYSDVNGDQNKDLVIYGSDDIVTLFLNQQLQILDFDIDILSPSTNDLSVEDIDQDGFMDLILLRDYGIVSIFFGSDQYLHFSEVQDYVLPTNTKKLTIHDLNKDGIKDLLISRETNNNGINTVLVSYGEGNRTFSEAVNWKYVPNPSRAIILDINNDGSEEVLFYARYGNQIFWTDEQNSDYNEFFSSPQLTTLTDGNGIMAIAVSDLNQDDSPDILTANRDSKNVSILINDGSGIFIESELYIGRDVLGVAALDYNGDQYKDILITTSQNGSYSFEVYLGDGSMQYNFEQTNQIDTYEPTIINIEDIENDGDFDIIINAWDYTTNEIFYNDNGIYKKGLNTFTSIGQAIRVYADLNGDMKIDAFSAGMNTGNNFFQINNSVSEPIFDGLDLVVGEPTFNEATFHVENNNDDGVFVIIREGTSPLLSDKPIDDHYYVVNSDFGNGGEMDGGYVSYFGKASNFKIQGLTPLTDYTAYIFSFNQNSPINSITNYSDDYITLNFTTTESLYLLKDLGPFQIDEDSTFKLMVDEYINLYGTYQMTVESSDLSTDVYLNGNQLEVLTMDNFFGETTVSIDVETNNENKMFNFLLTFNPVNDLPQIEQVNDVGLPDLEVHELEISIFDVDDDISTLTYDVTSSNDLVIKTEEISSTIVNGVLALSLSPLSFGETDITISVSDQEGTTSMSFKFLVDALLSIDTFLSNSLKVYPNPAATVLEISSPTRNGRMRIYNSQGQVVYSAKTLPDQLELLKFEDGLYILEYNGRRIRFMKSY